MRRGSGRTLIVLEGILSGRSGRIAAVILSGNWRVYLSIYGVEQTSSRQSAAASPENFNTYLNATLAAADGAGVPVLMLGPPIEFPAPLAPSMVRYELTHLPMGEVLEVKPDSFTADTHLKQLAAGRRNLSFISVLGAVCGERPSPLKGDAETTIVWATLHLTPEGSLYVMERLAPALDSFLERLQSKRQLMSRGAPVSVDR